MPVHLARRVLFFSLCITSWSARPAQAADVMCDPSYQDCRATLLALIRGETESIDVAMWFMEDMELADALVARHASGIPVRVLVDPRRNTTTPMNATILAKFQNAGLPMRYKVGGGILHWKFMIFNSRDTVQWSAANYGDYYFRPVVPYLNYTDEGIYFADDPAVVNSFRRKFDDSWVDTVGFAHYANVAGTPQRAYPLYAIDSAMSFVPAQDFSVRSRPLYDAETQRIDVIMYKITEGTHADGLIRAVGRGLPVRLIVEGERYRNRENVWQAYQVDRLYMAGVQIRERAHAGFLHQKSTLLYSQGLTIFGSSNWTTDSNRTQYEHNYFTTKPWFFTWFRNNFERKWGNTTGNIETRAFTPLPPDVPVYAAPANGATGISTTGATIRWQPGPWAHRADIYFGTSSTPPLVATNVSVSPNVAKTYTLPTLAPGTTYFWRVESKTIANRVARGQTYSFRTISSAPATLPDIVLYASEAPTRIGNVVVEADATAAGLQRLRFPNANIAKIVTPLAAPSTYVELEFTATAGRAYRLWMRGKAEGNSYANDSVHVQFSGSVNQSGTAVFRIGTTAGTEFNLESCSGCGLANWGWEDNGWGTGVLGPPIYFATTGTQRIRLQPREDGLSIDQIVLSPERYLTSPPGPAKNDTTVVGR